MSDEYRKAYCEGYNNALAELELDDKVPASRQLLNLTKTALESAERECETIRNATIEECARVADRFASHYSNQEIVGVYQIVAAAIRALKDK